jgi:hypothetical protein
MLDAVETWMSLKPEDVDLYKFYLSMCTNITIDLLHWSVHHHANSSGLVPFESFRL